MLGHDEVKADWVVTYRMSPRGPTNLVSSTVEFFRGSEEECRRIKSAFGGGSSDSVRTSPWEVVIGPVKEWEDFLKEFADDT